MNALRKELLSALSECGARRQPALRRSTDPDWLYATDLPAAADESRADGLAGELEAAGWRTEVRGQWIFLDAEAAEPPEGWYEGEFGAEAERCASILERHADANSRGEREGAEAGGIVRRLIKAGEEGQGAYAKLCRDLHAEWAEKLRKKEPIPGIHPGYFGK